MTSYDVLGSNHSLNAFWGTEKWVKENPKTYEAVIAAFDEAVSLIEKDPADAARIYIKWESATTPEAEIVEILKNKKDIQFTMTPKRLMDFADIMNKVGLVKQKPNAWSDMFFDGLHKRPGS